MQSILKRVQIWLVDFKIRFVDLTLQAACGLERVLNLAASPLKHTLVSAFFASEVF